MSSARTIEDFYKDKFNWVPDSLKKGIGHFNIFRREEFVGKTAKPVPYSRRDYCKISLLIGKIRIQYADKIVEINKQCLLFSNPRIPYNWEPLDEQQSGYICVFTPAFFHHFGNLDNYAVFQPGGTPIFELSDEQTATIKDIYERMFEELESDYEHKYADRVLQEAKILLKNTHWNVSEIAYTLGFNEVTHFNNFFKKKLSITPTQFKND